MVAAHTFNLVIVHTPGAQAVDDWRIVKAEIAEKAPDIDVRIVGNGKANPEIDAWLSARPSFVFSPCRITGFQPASGTIASGQMIDKLEQARRLSAAGLPAPRSAPLLRDQPLDQGEWGPLVVVKPRPDDFWAGMLVRIARPEELSDRFEELTRGNRVPMMVQEFIDTTNAEGHLHAYRVMTLFGRPLYCTSRLRLDPRPPLAEILERRSNAIAHNSKKTIEGDPSKAEVTTVEDRDVLDLAIRGATIFPEVPLLAFDIVRERDTGRLFVLEANPRGMAWHLSSEIVGLSESPERRKRKYDQFGALSLAAEVLIEKTRERAT